MSYKAICKFKVFDDSESCRELFRIFFDVVHSFSYREIETSCCFEKGCAYAYGLTESEKKAMKFVLRSFVRFRKEVK